jgi:hypothetical protein
MLVENPAQRSVMSMKNLSYNTYKEQSRDMILEILNERKENRNAILLRELRKKAKAAASWDYKELKAREEKQRKLLSKLSKPKKYNEADKVVSKDNQKVEAVEQRTSDSIRYGAEKSPLDEAKERAEKKNERIMREQEIVMQNYMAKQKKLEDSLARVVDERMLKFRLKKERREKQILKSKIQIILANLSKKSCHRFAKDYQRFATVIEKEKIKHGNKNEEEQLYNSITSMHMRIQKEKDNDPNSVLARSLTKKEVELIKEDPNFFISNKEIRNKLPIFYGFAAETKSKGGDQRESLYRTCAPATNSEASLREKTKSIIHNQSQDDMENSATQERNKEKKERLLINYAEMLRIRENKRMILQKRMEQKESIITENASKRLMERKQFLAQQRGEETERFLNSKSKR